MEMEHRLNELKTEFSGIIELKEENANIFLILEDKINKLKNSYSEFIKNNKNNLFVFGLDSFHFQGKLIDIEYEDIKRLFNAITNRMYCEYYKLHKIINEYVTENVTDKKILELTKMNNSFPVYRDLEPFKQYDFAIIQQIHELNISILHSLCSFLMSKEHDLKNYQTKNKTGLNIDNFVSTFNFNNTVMKEKVTLFITYIEFFHKLHSKYLKRFTTKIQLLISQLNYDVKFEDSHKPEVAKKNAMDSLKSEIKDKALLKTLKSNMSDNDELSVSSELYKNSDKSSSEKSSSDKSSNDDSGTENSGRSNSNSDASENEYVKQIDELNINKQDAFFSDEKLSPKVQFTIGEKEEKSQKNNDSGYKKGIIKSSSKENIILNSESNETSEQPENQVEETGLENQSLDYNFENEIFEFQSANDECLSGITTDSKDENTDIKFKVVKQKVNELLEPLNENDQESSNYSSFKQEDNLEIIMNDLVPPKDYSEISNVAL
jgi:hypothetical protein